MVDLNTGSSFPLDKRKIASTTSHARVVFWHYTTQNFPFATSLRTLADEGNVFGTESGILETEIESISTSKSMRQAAGTFEISLMPTKNWRQFLAPGDWLVIYLFNSVDEKFAFKNKNIVMLGNVDRVARVKEKDEQTDKTRVRYKISGRDFGKVFEDTDVFFNPYSAQVSNSVNLDVYLRGRGLAMAGTAPEFIGDFTDIFLSPDGGKITNPLLGNTQTPTLNQWGIPEELAQLFGTLVNGGAFHDILQKDLSDNLPGYKPTSVLNQESNGGLWANLRRNANELTNHLYLDLKRDSEGEVMPTIFLKSIPTSPLFNDLTAQLNDSSAPLQSLAKDNFVEISSNEIIFENMGRDGNYRFNMVWIKPKFSETAAIVNQLANVTNFGNIGLPMQNTESIQRHGLKRYEGTLDFCYQKITGAGVSLNIMLYKSFINLIYDLQAYHQCYETGTIECSGILEVSIGKALRVVEGNTKKKVFVGPPSSTDVPAKIYFIEGYKHSWRFPGRWVTELTLSMGQWDDLAQPFIDLSESDLGRADTNFDNTSLVKTNVSREGKASLSKTSLGNSLKAFT